MMRLHLEWHVGFDEGGFVAKKAVQSHAVPQVGQQVQLDGGIGSHAVVSLVRWQADMLNVLVVLDSHSAPTEGYERCLNLLAEAGWTLDY